MRKIKSLVIALAFVVFGASLYAADVTVTFVSGKVEVQRNGQWVALQKGDTVSKSETISTGFQSEAKIKILDSVMYLGPVTRITLEELSSSEQKDNVNVYLKTGTARSQVKHVDNKRVNYQVHTAVAVASCRGTGWSIDDANNVDCFDGTVAVSSLGDYVDTDDGGNKPTSANGILITANQSIKVSDLSEISAPIIVVLKNASDITNASQTTSDQEILGGAGLFGLVDEAGLFGSDDAAARETATVVVEMEIAD